MVDSTACMRSGRTLAQALGLTHALGSATTVLHCCAALMVLLAVCVTGEAVAQPSIPPSTSRVAVVRPDTQDVDVSSLAKEYGLSHEEVERYRDLALGPRGHWTADPHPLMVLGVHARNDAERRRYAEMLVEDDKRRTAAILALSRAVQQVWLDKYGNEPLFARSAPDPDSLRPSDRVLLGFVPGRCLPCSQAISRLQADALAHGGPGIDIYLLVDSDAQIQEFARQQLIAPEAVRRRQITLNRASPAWLAQLGLHVDALPIAVRRRGDQLTPINLVQLAERSPWGTP